MIKLADVAKLAGVSPTTVSRVINNYGYLSQKTINKVHAAMDELNYQPNNLARSLQGKSTNIIGLIFPNIHNPFYAELIENLEKRLYDLGYKTILCNSEKNPEKEKNYLKLLSANQVDGIIAGAHNLGIKEYEKITFPVISFDRFLAKSIPVISSDNLLGGKLVGEYFKKNGIKKAAIIAGESNSGSPTDLRHQGFLEVLPTAETLRIPANTPNVVKQQLIKKFITANHFDGVFCTDDLTAISVKGLTDATVAGYDGTQLIQQIYPNLATIVQPINEIAEVLVDTLIRKINKEQVEDRIILPVKLIQN